MHVKLEPAGFNLVVCSGRYADLISFVVESAAQVILQAAVHRFLAGPSNWFMSS